MKGAVLFVAIFALSILIIPMIALNFEAGPVSEVQLPVHSPAVPAGDASQVEAIVGVPVDDGAEEAQTEEPPQTTVATLGVREFKILDEATGQVETVGLRDFVRGAVAAEMPASFHSEALKAQAVAAHTFALHNHLVQQENPDPELKGADFAADPQDMKVYITEEIARDFYGDKADAYWKKICEAADSAVSYVLEYEDEPIVAAYHAISAGRTEDASNIWIGSAPYLQAVESGGDVLAPDFESKLSLSQEEVRAKLLAAWPDMKLQASPQDWFGEIDRSASGYITYIQVGDKELHGKDIRSVFDLRSHNIEIEYTDAGFVFHVVGYGHGVGLSQYGADFLARQGKTFDQILQTYYTGVTLGRISFAD